MPATVPPRHLRVDIMETRANIQELAKDRTEGVWRWARPRSRSNAGKPRSRSNAGEPIRRYPPRASTAADEPQPKLASVDVV
jgi:hypothetical protein